MEFFDKLSETIVSAGKDVGQKAKDVSEIAKLKLDIKSKEDYVQKQYEELGRSYYEKHKDEEGCEEAEQFFLIKEVVEEIERMKAEVLRIQGSAECPKCGAKMPEGAVYCSSCGTKMDDMYEEEQQIRGIPSVCAGGGDRTGLPRRDEADGWGRHFFPGCHKRHDAVGVSDAALSDLDVARGVGVCTGQCDTVPGFVENH